MSDEPDETIAALPALLANEADRERLLTLLGALLADERMQNTQPTEAQLATLDRILSVLATQAANEPPASALMRQ